MIPCQRNIFAIPDDISYLNCAYLSPTMKAVHEAGLLGVERKRRPWEVLPQHFFEETEEARTLFARLINTHADNVALAPSCSYGLAVAANNLRIGRGDRIVLLHEQFPSNVYPWMEVAATAQAEISTVERRAGETWTEAVLRELEQPARVVALPNTHWTDGRLVDLETIGQRCREIDADLVLDVTQSLGALPFSVAKVQPSFLVCAGYKWLLGPYSTAFLYVDPRYHDGRPLEGNWLNRKGSEVFSGLVDYRDEYQAGARRYDVGERSNFALMPMVVAALKQILAWGVPEINKTLSAMTECLAAQAMELQLEIAPEAERAGHMLGLRFPQGLPPKLTETLAANKVFVSLRGNAVRIAPHLYNDERDFERLMGSVTRVLK